jgi:SH3-like domain-containing protein
LSLVFLIALAFGCKKDSIQQYLGTPPSDPAGPPEVPLSYVVATATLRLLPTTEPEISIDGRTRTSRNWVGTLVRGDRVRVYNTQEGWSQIITEVGTTGWIETSSLIEGDGVFAAVSTTPVKLIEQSDETTRMQNTLAPGELMLVLEMGQSFARVNIGNNKVAWVHVDVIDTDTSEIAMARALVRIRAANAGDSPVDVQGILEEAVRKFPRAKLIDTVAQEVLVKRLPTEGLTTTPTFDPY